MVNFHYEPDHSDLQRMPRSCYDNDLMAQMPHITHCCDVGALPLSAHRQGKQRSPEMDFHYTWPFCSLNCTLVTLVHKTDKIICIFVKILLQIV